MGSRAPFSKRQVHEKEEEEEGKLTGGLVGRLEEEIDAAAPTAGGALAVGGAARVGWSGEEVREMQGVVLPLYRVEEEEEEARKAVAWELADRPLMAAAAARWRAVTGRGKAGRRRSGWWRLHLWRSGGGGGARGGRGRRDGRRPARPWGGRGQSEVGDDPDRWAPPVGGHERGRGVLGCVG
jgi:hypothetical protein